MRAAGMGRLAEANAGTEATVEARMLQRTSPSGNYWRLLGQVVLRYWGTRRTTSLSPGRCLASCVSVVRLSTTVPSAICGTAPPPAVVERRRECPDRPKETSYHHATCISKGRPV